MLHVQVSCVMHDATMDAYIALCACVVYVCSTVCMFVCMHLYRFRLVSVCASVVLVITKTIFVILAYYAKTQLNEFV